MKARLIPWADVKAQWFAAVSPGTDTGRVDKVVLHTTEGTSWPGYGGGGSAPNVTIMADFATKTVQVRQHFPAGMSSKALVNLPGGVETNRDGAFQIEIVGTSGWATTRNKSAPYQLAEQWYAGGFPDWVLAGIARIIRWLNTEWGVPLTSPQQGFGNWAQGARRFTNAEWTAFRGVCGHQHVPENDHTDPGLIDIAAILRLAQPPKTAPTRPVKDEFTMDTKSAEQIRAIIRDELQKDRARPAIPGHKDANGNATEWAASPNDLIPRTANRLRTADGKLNQIIDLLKGKK